ncbi:MAG: replicative DNA helicase [Bacilli bacterium]|nr:replicative DNA helicase [Bacilli bacterium]
MPKKYKIPSNVEAEKTVLGSLLCNKDVLHIVMSNLVEDDFSGVEPRNQLVFRAMAQLYDQKTQIDVQTVHAQLVNLKTDGEVGSPEYLMTLIDSVVSLNPDEVEHYMRIIKDQAVLRKLLKKFNDLEGEYAEGEIQNVSDFLEKASNEISEVVKKRSVGDFKTAGDVAKSVEAKILEMSEQSDNSGVTGVTTGYRRLDKLTHGWQKDDLIIVAARPAMGKTALSMNFVYNAASKGNVPVAFFSLEMSAEAVMKRFLAMVSYVPHDDLQTGNLRDPKSRVKLNDAVNKLANCPLYIDDTPNSTLGDIVAKCTKLKSAHPDLGLIVVDYLGKVTMSNKPGKNDSRQQEVSYISGAFKTLARQLHVPVILICQLNRNVEKTDSKVPMLSDLRESGSIEQDADQVILLHRKDYYTNMGQKVGNGGKGNWTNNKFGKQVEAQAQQPEQDGPQAPDLGLGAEANASVMHILLAKNRSGQVGTSVLIFSKSYSKFDDPTLETEQKIMDYEKQMGDSVGF